MKNVDIKGDISKIIYDGIRAPSGENSQPWRFLVDGYSIFVLNVIGRDTTLYNAGQHGSYVAHGALIENMVLSAGHHGYEAEVIYFPSESLNPVAKIVLKKAKTVPDELYDAIPHRHTNRHDYRTDKLPETVKQDLIAEAEKLDMGSLRILDDDKHIKVLARASAAVEQLMFENKLFHKFFYEHFFMKQQDENKPSGLYIDTLGLSPFELIGTKLTQSWYVCSFLRITRAYKLVIMMRQKHYLKSGAFGAIIAKGDSPINYVQTGRIVERVWLKANQFGVSLQPCGGILYLWEGVMKAVDIFTEKEKNIIHEARNQILEEFGIQGETVPMFFRMGYTDELPTRSFRYEPEIDHLS